MPSRAHEALLAIVRDAPDVLAPWLDTAPGTLVPAPESQSLADVPVYVGDLCFLERDADGRARRAFVVEAQRAIVRAKARVWPLLVAGTASRHGCDAYLVVLTESRRVARWAGSFGRRRIGSLSLAPIVIGPGDVPRLDDATAVAQPMLAVLSAIVHADAPAAAMAMRAVASLDEEPAHRYKDLVWAVLPAAARALLEETMKTTEWQPLSDDFRRERADGARHMLPTLCSAVGVEWTDERARAVSKMSLAEIDRLAETLVATRAWPDAGPIPSTARPSRRARGR